MIEPDSAESRGPVAKPGLYYTYQKYDPLRFPSPAAPAADLVTPMMEWMMMYGSDTEELSDEQLRRAVRIDPAQMGGLGPSLQSIRRFLLERKAKILATYEVESALGQAGADYNQLARHIKPPKPMEHDYRKAALGGQRYSLERLWYRLNDQNTQFGRQLMRLIGRLETLTEVQILQSKYAFTGRQALNVEEAVEVKAELEKIDDLLKQLEEAEQTGQIGLIDLDELRDFIQEGDPAALNQIRDFLDQVLEQASEREGLERRDGKWRLSPKAMRLYQSRLLAKIFSELQASRTGRHDTPVSGEGAVEMAVTQPYQFGDSLAAMDWTQTLTNALVRQAGIRPLRLYGDDM